MAKEENAKAAKEITIIPINAGDDDKGVVQVTNNVIASIVKKYALTVDGVVRTAPQSLADGFANMLSRRAYESSINLELTDEGAVITLALILKFGASVPQVSKEIQDILFEKIPEISGYTVAKVNVNVIDLEEEIISTDDDVTIVSEDK